jgi:plastocyanin
MEWNAEDEVSLALPSLTRRPEQGVQMRKLLPIVLMLAALAGGSTGLALPQKTVAVSITHVAFVPNNVQVQTGDTVTWTNNDTVNHQLVSQQAGIGSPIVTPGNSWSFTFTKTGKFSIADSLNKKFPKMTVTVTAAPASLSLASSASTVSYGGTITLSGKLSTGRDNAKVDVLAQECGQSAAKKITTVTTSGGGAFSLLTHPTMATVYSVKTGNVTSGGVTVKVRPRVVLSRIRTGLFRLRVYAGQSLAGHAVVFRRYIVRTRSWRTVKTVVLRVQSTSVTPLSNTVVSSVSFGVRLRRGFRVRAIMTSAAAAPCYVAGASGVIRS